jgi:hypothetical protein
VIRQRSIWLDFKEWLSRTRYSVTATAPAAGQLLQAAFSQQVGQVTGGGGFAGAGNGLVMTGCNALVELAAGDLDLSLVEYAVLVFSGCCWFYGCLATGLAHRLASGKAVIFQYKIHFNTCFKVVLLGITTKNTWNIFHQVADIHPFGGGFYNLYDSLQVSTDTTGFVLLTPDKPCTGFSRLHVTQRHLILRHPARSRRVWLWILRLRAE